MYDNDDFVITSFQPYLKSESDDFTDFFMNTKGISHFFSFQNNTNEEKSIFLIPDSCSNIIFIYSKDYRKLKKAFVINANMEIEKLIIEPQTLYFGVRFQPGENPCFTENNIKQHFQKQTDLNEFSQMQNYLSKLSEFFDFSTQINLFLEEYLQTFDKKISFKHKLFRQFIRLIVSRKGILKISELVNLTGYSSRYVNQIFDDISGISAKHFCTNVKLQNIAADITNKKFENFAKLSSDYKFYDTAHFIHEFKNFSGKTPGEYFEYSAKNKN